MNPPPLEILIDYREYKSGIYETLSKNKEVKTTYTDLELGDYLVNDQFLFERKTIKDFASSIKDGRLFRQACRLINGSFKPILLLEGTANDLRNSEMGREAIQGALINITLILGIPMLRAKSPQESAQLMIYTARQIQRIAHISAFSSGKRPKGKRANQLRLLQALPGIGPKRAFALLNKFGSLDALFKATIEELDEVSGIGGQTAANIHWILHEPQAAYGMQDLWGEI